MGPRRGLLVSGGCDLVIDESGVGRAVGDMFNAAGLRPVRVSITAGTDATIQGERRWSVSKALLISGVDARLHSGDALLSLFLLDLAPQRRDLRLIQPGVVVDLNTRQPRYMGCE